MRKRSTPPWFENLRDILCFVGIRWSFQILFFIGLGIAAGLWTLWLASMMTAR